MSRIAAVVVAANQGVVNFLGFLHGLLGPVLSGKSSKVFAIPVPGVVGGFGAVDGFVDAA
jgi:hypothetical protein